MSVQHSQADDICQWCDSHVSAIGYATASHGDRRDMGALSVRILIGFVLAGEINFGQDPITPTEIVVGVLLPNLHRVVTHVNTRIKNRDSDVGAAATTSYVTLGVGVEFGLVDDIGAGRERDFAHRLNVVVEIDEADLVKIR